MLFVKGIILPSAIGPQLYNSCMADFQKETFESLAPSMHAIRDGKMPPVKRFWIERTKKSSKDTDLAVALIWLMVYPKRPFKCQVCASNSRQARIIEDRIIDVMHYNPWLNDYIEVIQGIIRNKKMHKEVWVRIEATGTAGEAQGQTPDLLLLNELVHVDQWSTMQTHWNNATGVPQGVIIILTNAGIKGTPADGWRKEAMGNPKRWAVHVWAQLAPWISKEDVEEARRQDPIGAEFARLWRGQWISGTGGAVDEHTIDKAFCLDGPQIYPVDTKLQYLGGLDLGVNHDHSGLMVLALDEEKQKIKTVFFEGWEPSLEVEKNKLEVDLMEVEKRCEWAAKHFNITWFGYDPAAGGSFMAQRLRKKNVPMQEVSFSKPVNLTAMAKSFVQVMKGGILQCYDTSTGRLRRDFGKFSIEHRPPSHYKLVSISDDYGHADVGTALVICLPEACIRIEGYSGLRKDDVLFAEDDSDLTKEEIDELPDELRELYEFYDSH